MNKITLSLLASLTLHAAAPDLIIHNGRIVSVDSNFTIHQAMAVADGKIQAVGTNEEILGRRGEKTMVVDLKGGTVLPGLIDSHTHPAGAAMTEFDHEIPEMESVADVLSYFKKRAEVTQPGDWIQLQQVFITRLREQRYPTRSELDMAAPNHPAIFRTGPDAALNTLALKLSGIDRNFEVKDGGPGFVEKDPTTGEPTGILRNCTRFVPVKTGNRKASDEEKLARLKELFRDYNSVGITTIADRAASMESVKLYQRLLQEKQLPLRVRLSMDVPYQGELSKIQERIRQIGSDPLHKTHTEDQLAIIGIKTFLDGGMLTGSAFMREPWGVSSIYGISDPQYRGVRFIPKERLVAVVKTAVESGLQFTAHSVGDGAVHALLEAYEHVNRELPVSHTRPCITHANFQSPEAIALAAKLGVCMDIQPAWLYLDSHTLTRQFGLDRMRWFQPLGSLFKAGVTVGGGSDHMQKIGRRRSINPYDPFLGMATAISRKAKNLSEPLHKEESLSRKEALQFYTINNAKLLFAEKQIGSLEAGKLADFVLLDRDILAVPESEIASTKIVKTYLQGKEVYSSAQSSALVYPKTAKTNHVDHYHGVEVADPYRWLEDDNAPATEAWVKEQNAVTFGFLESIPERQKIKEKLTTLWNYERFGNPSKRNDRYFLTHNNGLQNQSVIYTLQTLDGPLQELLDPNKLSSDGTVSISSFVPTDDGAKVAYGISASGSDWQTWKVRDTNTRQDLADEVNWVKFSTASWLRDGSGFFYSRYDSPAEGKKLQGLNYYHKLYFHKIGTPQSEDKLIYERKDQKEWGFDGEVSEKGDYLVISIWQGTERRNRIYYQDLRAQEGKVTPLLDEFDAAYEFIGNKGSTFWFLTDRHAPKGKVIAIDLNKPAEKNWKTLISEASDTLETVTLVNQQFVARYMHDAYHVVKIFDLEGRHVRDVDLPGLGSVTGFRGKSTDTETFYSYESFTQPASIYRYDFLTGKSSIFKQPKVPFRSEDYETRQVFFASKDGTRIPMFISHKKGLTLDGQRPTLLYGYGGFNISLTPSFSPANLLWMQMGGVYAQPNLRGGGEYGKEWHNAGKKLRKQNVFDDFIYAARWLTNNHYTRPERLAIAGGSNGGLLVGACMTQHPELFGAALPAVGVMDMLRFHKFTIGWAWTSDYGSSDNETEFKALYAYSPLHNLKAGTRYPATLITTADHDDRVVPAHSFKFAAQLQESHRGDPPVLIRIETKAGHGAGKPTSKRIEEAADKLAFLVKTLEMKPDLE